MYSKFHLPNLLLAGAPKCGTTSVYDWLVSHPEISGGVDKELFYLLDESDWKFNSKINWLKDKELGYSKYFPENNKYRVDGTTLTLYQNCALSYAQTHKVKMLAFVRDPADRIYSTFKYFRDTRTVLPEEMTFSQFLELVNNGHKFNGINQLSDVILQSKYSLFIERWVNAIGAENIKVIDFERLKQEKQDVMWEICTWLKISPKFYETFEFSHKNETTTARYRLLNQVKEVVGKNIKSKRLKGVIRPIYDIVNRKSTSKSIPEEDVKLIEKLREQLANEVELAISYQDKVS